MNINKLTLNKMKVRKLLTLALVMTFAGNVAQGQQTPHAIIKQCPALPAVDILVVTDISYDLNLVGEPFKEKLENAEKAKKAFHDKIESLDTQRRDIQEKRQAGVEATAKQDANRIARQMTGRSTEQLENMSESETMAMANNMAGKRLSAAGLGNMSLGDLQALENKSEEDIMKALSGATPTQAETPQRMSAAQSKEQADVQRIAEESRRIQSLNNLSISEAQEELKNIYDKHRKALIEKASLAQKYFEGYMDHRQYTHAQYAAAQRNYESVQEAYLTECYTYWLNLIAQMQKRSMDIIEAMLPEVKNPPANMAGLAAYDLAGLYLNLTSNATLPPLFRGYDNENDSE